MKNWLTSLNGTITISVLALLTFLGRAFMDWRYEYPQQDPAGNWDTPMALIYMALVGGWLWGLMAASRGSRRGLIVCLIAVLLLDVALALATYIFLCPPWTDCVGWPNAWSWNWSNLILGAIAAVAIAFQLRSKGMESNKVLITDHLSHRMS